MINSNYFQIICSYLFWPLALLIGVEVKYCRDVAKLLGVKIFTSELLAFQDLGDMAANELRDSVG